ncbi:hypothetical protein CE143_11700 [Photorhabdus luminescens]|uniref:Uncharacterized protein n=1 Tax=Photorhabdus akhurstii TaxID=171438 RepID=A0ABX8LU68_9GAMM|nr:hypothetical protein [Photorhabdus akhurstii]KGM29798.1 hypothetical protein KS18_02725 [Photorhabdus luminescens]MBS9427193.1 hypothetical protein [Photorhabdus akhurstii]PQQ28954.1 hypothetical protein C6H64_13715 [Photorhabdus luminescens]PQQ33699.1 hypothetical protein C6H69_09235 [Photorhabdus luminescens]PQQ40427.1 hypothetical protein C6H65_15300 [Photorhabdus luminescens]
MNTVIDNKQDWINLRLKNIGLNNQDSEAFFNALVKPVRFNKKLADAFEEHNQRVINKRPMII